MATLLQRVKVNMSGCFRSASWLPLGVLLVSLILINGFWLPPALAATQPGMVTKQVTAVFSGLRLNRATGTFDSVATLKNNSDGPMPGSLSLVINGINPSSVTLANATGTLSGVPYLDVPVANNILEAGATTMAVLRFNNPSRVSFTFNHQVAQDPQGVLNYILNSDQVPQTSKDALQQIYAAYQAKDPERVLELLEANFAGPIEESFKVFNEYGEQITIPENLADTPKMFYNILMDHGNILTNDGLSNEYYNSNNVNPLVFYLDQSNRATISAKGFGNFALVDEQGNPLNASGVTSRFLHGEKMLLNGVEMRKTVYKKNLVEMTGWLYAGDHNQNKDSPAYWSNLISERTGGFAQWMFFQIPGSSGYEKYDFESGFDDYCPPFHTCNFTHDFSKPLGTAGVIVYEAASVPVFKVRNQMDNVEGFADIITSKLPKKAVIYTHGTLLFNWGVPFPISLMVAQAQSDRAFCKILSCILAKRSFTWVSCLKKPVHPGLSNFLYR